jgi:hypothetical protein
MTASGGVGGPYTFSATGLPTGLTMSSSGTISGTTTSTGTFNYTVTITDRAGNTGTVNCSVTVYPPPSATCISITAIQGTPITPVTMTGSGGVGGPYTFSATGLPAGLTMSSSGTISGTPTVNGTFNYTVTVTDSAGNKGTVNCSVTVAPPISASCVSITAVQGTAITPVTMTASGGAGGPYTFSATGLPAGLTMSSSGTISGTPTVSGTFNYTVTITDKAGNTGTVNCSVTVAPPSVTCNCGTLTVYKNVPMTPVTLSGSGGVGGPYTFSNASGLPAGVTISSSGVISGTPTVTGTFNFTVTVADKNGNKSTLNCKIIVNTPPAPTCSVNDQALTMTYNSAIGIARLDVTTNLNNNFKVNITPSPTSTTFSPNGNNTAMPAGEYIKFPSPVTSAVTVAVSRINTSKSAQLTVQATDAAGQTITCDPVTTVLSGLNWKSGLNGVQTFTNLPQAAGIITINNGTPGLNDVLVLVNGFPFIETKMTDGQVIDLNVSKAMKPGNNNTIVLVGIGTSGNSSAQIYISQ